MPLCIMTVRESALFRMFCCNKLGEMIKMKSFTYKALAVAAATVCGSAAIAGSQSVTPTNFALEAITNATAVTVPPVTLTMGVTRTVAQDFTVVIKPQAGATFVQASCAAALPTDANFTASVKRASTSECAYEIDVTEVNGTIVGQTVVFTGLQLASHSLVSGSNASIGTGVWELSEFARIDNSNDLINTVATASQAITLVAAADAFTTVDVDNANGPLFGFLPDANGAFTPLDDDTASIARAGFIIRNNPSNLKIADGVTNFDANNAAHMDSVRINLVGDFNGAASVDAAFYNATNVATGIATATVDTANGTATFSMLPGNFASQSNNGTVVVWFTSALTASLGISRTFGISGVTDPDVGANQALAGNASWWTWDANAIQLRSAFFNNDTSAGNFTRFFFQNVGSSTAAYTAVCYVDDAAKTITYGTAQTGTLRIGQTTINAADVCTFSAGQRGAITFTINAPAKNVKGVYQQAINGVAAGYLPLERPYLGSSY